MEQAPPLNVLDYMPSSVRADAPGPAAPPLNVFDYYSESTRSHFSQEQIEAARQQAESGDHYQHDPGEFLARRSIPFASAIANLVEGRSYSNALERLRSGQGTQRDRDVESVYEARKRNEQNQGDRKSTRL